VSAGSDHVDGQAGDPAGPGGGTAYPVMRVVRGNPTDEEVAALVAVLSALGGGADDPSPARQSAWGSPARAVRAPLSAGPGGWQASALPH
jgi:hypothetical protein